MKMRISEAILSAWQFHLCTKTGLRCQTYDKNSLLSHRCYFTFQNPKTNMKLMLGLRMGQQAKKKLRPNEI